MYSAYFPVLVQYLAYLFNAVTIRIQYENFYL